MTSNIIINKCCCWRCCWSEMISNNNNTLKFCVCSHLSTIGREGYHVSTSPGDWMKILSSGVSYLRDPYGVYIVHSRGIFQRMTLSRSHIILHITLQLMAILHIKEHLKIAHSTQYLCIDVSSTYYVVKQLLKILVRIYILVCIRGGGGGALTYISSTGMFRSEDLFLSWPPLFAIVPVPKTPIYMKNKGNWQIR